MRECRNGLSSRKLKFWEDPDAFTMPWNAIQRFRRFEAAVAKVPIERLTQLATPETGPLTESFCAENPALLFSGCRC
jgi:hypothetical protein